MGHRIPHTRAIVTENYFLGDHVKQVLDNKFN